MPRTPGVPHIRPSRLLRPSRNCPHQCSQSIGDLAEGLRAQAAQQRERHDLARKALGAAHLDGGDGDEVRDADGDHGPARARREGREAHRRSHGKHHRQCLRQDREREGEDRQRKAPHGEGTAVEILDRLFLCRFAN